MAIAIGFPGIAARADGGAPEASVTAVEPVSAAPTRGPITNLPLPRFVSLKTSEGNARRGPGLSHRIDWVFTHPGMPLLLTAEHENWRRVEDFDGAGGWVHYSLLSGTRTVIVSEDLAELAARPEARAEILARAELGVIARLLECRDTWCRVSADGTRGWMRREVLWGIGANESID